ncbi:MAG: cold shock domain-containing protein [Magnetococcales bacterium]|nr:cold shock domain-containing protein [Magnetococcales bacterium]MBF0157603.1 cold shock domain-containing protein [Magnetococcales bacterium]
MNDLLPSPDERPGTRAVSAKLHRCFLVAEIFNTGRHRTGSANSDWVDLFHRFLALVSGKVVARGGQIVSFLDGRALAVFSRTGTALQAAIEIQETLLEHRLQHGSPLSGKIAISWGEALRVPFEGGGQCFVGGVVDQAERLCEKARGNAIILTEAAFNADPDLSIHSQMGLALGRSQEDYFHRESPCRIGCFSHPVGFFSVLWQGPEGEYLATSPMEEGPVSEPPERQVYFGKVAAFKKDRGFGFIQYFADEDDYREIYFHMTYVINQVPVAEHDNVQFVIKPGKGGRPQACSVLVMGSRLQGRVATLFADGTGHLTIRNHDSETVRFFMLPQEVNCEGLRIHDMVEFTVGSGSEIEGLLAMDVSRISATGATTGATGAASESLKIGSVERAVVTTYFNEKGYGFAKCRHNNIYLHISELANPEATPGAGDWIEFEVFPGRDGTYRASHIRLITPETNNGGESGEPVGQAGE